MAETQTCPECGMELPADAPAGICPKCLLQAGFSGPADAKDFSADAATIPPIGVEGHVSDEPTIPQTKAMVLSEGSEKTTDATNGTRVRYFGDYEIIEEIARGGMGVVYKAKQVNLNRVVAIKMILAGQLASKQDVQRFYTEAEAAANLQHPNIVAIHEVGEHEGQHYFSMDLVDGKSLADLIRENPLPAAKAAEYVKIIAEAIHYAHQQGTLHRDLKPANILIDANDQPRVTDFGLAKKVEGDSELTASGAVLGTPSYMPPEQAAAKRGQIGPASDVYSLGAILYELLTGRPPFRAETSLDTLLQVLENDPVSPRQLNPAVPRDLETICLKCLEKEPRRRYHTAQDLANDLARYLRHEPIQARPISRRERVLKWARRRPTAAALLAVSVLSALSVVVLVGFLWQNAEKRAETVYNLNEARTALSNLDSDLNRTKREVAKQERLVGTERAEAERLAALTQRERKRALDMQARSLYHQAGVVRTSTRPGRRWQALQLVRRAEALRGRQAQAVHVPPAVKKPNVDPDLLSPPSRAELRSEAVAALLLADGRVRREWPGFLNSISPDGRFAAVYEIDLTKQPPKMSLRQVDLETGKDVKRWNRPKMASGAIALSPGGKLLATAATPGKKVTVRLWDMATGQITRTLQIPILLKQPTPVPKPTDSPAIQTPRPPQKARPKSDEPKPKRNPGVRKTTPKSKTTTPAAHKPAVAKRPKTGRDIPRTKVVAPRFGGVLQRLHFSPDGRYLAGIVFTGAESHVILWDFSGDSMGIEVGSARGMPLSNLSFSRDRSLLAFPSGKNHVTVWDIQKQKAVTKIDLPMADMVGLVSFSNDGRLLAMNGYSEKEETSATIVWDLEHDREQQRFSTGMRVFTALSFNADATRLALADMTGRIVVYRLDERREEFRLDHGSMPQLLRWGNDGKRLYSGGMGSLKEWELAVDRPLRVFRAEDQTPVVLSQFDFSPNGKWLVFGGMGRTVRLYRWPTGTLERSLKLAGGGGTVRFSPDNRRLSVHNGFRGTTVINAETGEKLGRIAADFRNQKLLYSTAFTGEGRCLAAGGDKGRATVWDVETGKIIWQTGKVDKTVTAIARLSPDGRLVATWKQKFSPILKSVSQEMELWDLKSKQVIHRLPAEQATAAATFSPRGRWLAVVSGGNWMARLGGRPGGPSAGARAAVFGSNEDWIITLWNTQTGKQQFKTRGPRAEMIAFSPDGRLLALRFRGGTVELWNVEQKEQLFRWSLPKQSESLLGMRSYLTFTADGRFLAASAGITGGILLLDLRTLREQLQQIALGW